MTTELGKRYSCSVCKQEIICVKGGSGVIACCDKPMGQLEPRKLPSSD
jgi:hypothetical protein